MDEAVALTRMEFGGITPLGLPAGWPILVDESVAVAGDVVIGSGLRRSKLLVPARALVDLPGSQPPDSRFVARRDGRLRPGRWPSGSIRIV